MMYYEIHINVVISNGKAISFSHKRVFQNNETKLKGR